MQGDLSYPKLGGRFGGTVGGSSDVTWASGFKQIDGWARDGDDLECAGTSARSARVSSGGTWKDSGVRSIAPGAVARCPRADCPIPWGSTHAVGSTIYLAGGHSHAAPRTPLESPYLAFKIGVVTLSEKTYLCRSKGTSR